MAHSCCSANFSSRSLRSCLPSSGSSCGSSYPSNLVYTTSSCSPSTCQLGSSLNSGCEETCIEPTSCQRSCVESSPCQTACYYPRSFTPCSPCQGTYVGPLGFGPSSFHSLDCGSRGCYIVGCGPSDFESLYFGVSGFPFQRYGPRFCLSPHLPVSTCQAGYKPICGNTLYGVCY
ncbi:keratin-associated protein 13-1-like [Phodopus roborovskii]|uniref:keratin-associated protein 13-1-like n=1 Tax=Phodopus roborovskii TaxID=109678 RepID=UPI0021E41C71|nr:keratin-associated protein 13-1-like [Phodopus roborovskii]